MKRLMTKTLATIGTLTLVTVFLTLFGCGGGGGGSLSSQVVSGTASVGAPLTGQVTLKDSSATHQTKTTVIASDGTFAVDVTDMKSPFILQAIGTAAGVNYKLHSYADGPGIANINPLSEAIVASAAGDSDAAQTYDKADSDSLHKIGSNLAATVNILLSKLQPLLQQYNAQNTNPITAHYIVNHLGLDELFDNVKITVANGMLSISNAKTGVVIYSGKLNDIANGNFNPGTLPTPPAVPAAPTGLSAVGGTGQVSLSWGAVSNATSYNLYFSTTSGVTIASGTKLSSVTSPYVQTGLAAGTTYYYVVTAVNSAGESAASAQASAKTTATVPVPTAPAAPTGVKATGGTKQVTVSWTAVTGATAYNIYWSTASGVTTATGTKLSNAVSPAVQTGLSDATTYYYIVTAINSTGESAPSAQVAATTLSAVPTPVAPAAPTGVMATGGTNQATISWSAASGATSYNLYWSTTAGVTTANGTKLSGVTSPYVQTGLAAGTAYYYVVTAVNSAGESPASAQATATTTAPAPAFDALSFYNNDCLGCHGTLGPRTAAQITSAIATFGAMAQYRATGSTPLTAAQIAAIAAVSH